MHCLSGGQCSHKSKDASFLEPVVRFQKPPLKSCFTEANTVCSYVRLELLEGVAALDSGERFLARAKLRRAQGGWQKLQVPDECLAKLMCARPQSWVVS